MCIDGLFKFRSGGVVQVDVGVGVSHVCYYEDDGRKSVSFDLL